jgi:hypothetical protein
VTELASELSLKGAALDWASRGFPVFPCLNLPGAAEHKSPLTPHGFHDATTDKAQIEAWWTRHANALIGMPTGSTTGIGVIDIDKKNGKDGYAAVPGWEQLSTVIAKTGGGGVHLYFRVAGPLRSTTGKDGVDTRVDGAYVIVPPSPGYSWLKGQDFSSLPPFPDAYRPAEYVAARAEKLEAADPAMVAAALRVIPNGDEDYDSWVRIGLAVFAATGGSDEGFEAWDEWSANSVKYCARTTAKRWEGFHRSPPNAIGAGTIFHKASAAVPSWREEYEAEADAKAQAQFDAGAAEFSRWIEAGGRVNGAYEAEALRAEGKAPSEDEVFPLAAENFSSVHENATEAGSPSETPDGEPADERDRANGTGDPKGTEQPPPPPQASALGEWNAGEDDWEIPPRGWLLGNVFCRRMVSALVADGAVGKTAFRLLQALSVATGRQLTGEPVFQRGRVLYVSLEDDCNELRRRVRAAMLHYDIRNEEIEGWLFLAAPEGKAGKLVTINARTKRPEISKMKGAIEQVIVRERIDLLILDPLVKTHDVEENDNSAMDVVIQTLSGLAVDYDIAVDILHHTSKGSADPGNAHRARGASAVNNGARLVYTLSPMSSDEADRFGVDHTERRSHVRVDSGKVNITPPLEMAQWFKIVSVPLGNATALYPNGDRVQTVTPWTPPDTWDGISDNALSRILDDIDKGLPADPERSVLAGGRYSSAPKASTRAAWPVVARYAPGQTEKQCRRIIAELMKHKRLVEKSYHDPNDRRVVKGLYLPDQNDADNEPI